MATVMEAGALSQNQAQRCLAVLAGLSYRGRTLAEYLRVLCEQMTELFGGGLAAVTLYRDGTKQVLAVSPGEADLCTAYSPEGALSSYVVESGQPLRLFDGRNDDRFGVMDEGYAAYMGVPLRLPHGGTLGTVCYFDALPRNFTDADLQVALMFAERAATAIDNFALFQQVTDFKDNLERQVAERTRELRAAQEKLIQHAKLAAIGEFATTISHEIRGPLSAIRLNLDYLSRQEWPASTQRRIVISHEEAQRLERLLGDMLLTAKPMVLNRAPLDLVDFVRASVTSLSPHAEAAGVSHHLDLPDTPLVVTADRDRLMQVVINLSRNACEAATRGSLIYWRLNHHPERNAIALQVQNDGEVIPPETLARLTEPFFSTKPQGTGLGLAVVKSIVTAHGGEFLISTSQVHGTTVTIYLPGEV